MNVWEQFILGFVLSLLHSLRIDPARVGLLRVILLDIYDGIGEVLNLPPRVTQTAPVATSVGTILH